GRQARAAGIERVFALGSLAAEAARTFGEGGRVFATHDALACALGEEIAAMAAPAGSAAAPAKGGLQVLGKGTRGSAMDRIVAARLASHPKGGADAACALPVAGATREPVRHVPLHHIPRDQRGAHRAGAFGVVG